MEQQLDKKHLTMCPVARQAQLIPQLIAVQTPTQEITFAELHKRISFLSLQLIKLNMKKGDRLVSIMQNGLPQLLLQLTCLRNGFIFCPINPNFSTEEKQQRLGILDSPFICQQDDRESLNLDFSSPSEIICNNMQFNIDPLTIVSIIFTSGSSGSPKAVMHHFSNHYYSALGSQSIIPLNAGDRNLLSLPMFHISGYATIMRTILAGATLQISAEKMNVAQLIKHKITHLSLVSSQLQQLLKDPQFQFDRMSIKHLLLGGSAFSSKVLQQTQQRGFTYHLSYGSTEMASQIATSTNSESLQLLPYRKLKIVDNEIQLAGETRFAGYFKGDSQRALIAQSHYFASSDLGELTGETVKIIGRKDRQFISGGENIQPEEIEKTLLTFPALAQVYVLPINDSDYGQRPVAFIKWHNHTHRHSQLEQLKVFLKDKLIAFKQPLHYFDLPAQQGLKPNRELLSNLAFKLLS